MGSAIFTNPKKSMRVKRYSYSLKKKNTPIYRILSLFGNTIVTKKHKKCNRGVLEVIVRSQKRKSKVCNAIINAKFGMRSAK